MFKFRELRPKLYALSGEFDMFIGSIAQNHCQNKSQQLGRHAVLVR